MIGNSGLLEAEIDYVASIFRSDFHSLRVGLHANAFLLNESGIWHESRGTWLQYMVW